MKKFVGIVVFSMFLTACSPYVSKDHGVVEKMQENSDLGFVAFGTEPFWSLTVSGNQALRDTPDASESFSLQLKSKGLGYLLYSEFLSGNISLQDCQDDSIGDMHHYYIFLQKGGETYEGCGDLIDDQGK